MESNKEKINRLETAMRKAIVRADGYTGVAENMAFILEEGLQSFQSLDSCPTPEEIIDVYNKTTSHNPALAAVAILIIKKVKKEYIEYIDHIGCKRFPATMDIWITKLEKELEDE